MHRQSRLLSQVGPFFLCIILFSMVSCSVNAGVSYTPPAPFGFVTLTISTDGISLQAAREFVTEIGTFSVDISTSSSAASFQQADAKSLLLTVRYRKDDLLVDTVYRLNTGGQEVIVTTNGQTVIHVTNDRVLIDASKGSIQTIEVRGIYATPPIATRIVSPWVWHTQLPALVSLKSITWSGSQFVVVGDNGTILTSSNGRTWTNRNSGLPKDFYGSSANLNDVIWSGSQFVIVGNDLTILTSPDGQTWTTQSNNSQAGALNSVVWSGSQFVAVGDKGMIYTSFDGHTWSYWYPGTSVSGSASFRDIVWSGSQFIVVGDGATILTSFDARVWTRQYGPDGLNGTTLDSIAWSGSQFVIVAGYGTILTSLDGETWIYQNPDDTSIDFTRVAWLDSQVVIIGKAGTILISSDGKTWTFQDPHNSENLNSIAWSGSQFVIVGDNGTVLISPGATHNPQST